MATLIPALGTCVSRTTGGERRMAEGEVVFAWSYGVVLLYAAATRATQRLVLARNAIPGQ